MRANPALYESPIINQVDAILHATDSAQTRDRTTSGNRAISKVQIAFTAFAHPHKCHLKAAEMENGSMPKITLYTNYGCPYAHRVHIALKELGLPYEEVIIDLDKPREPWYLKVNPV